MSREKVLDINGWVLVRLDYEDGREEWSCGDSIAMREVGAPFTKKGTDKEILQHCLMVLEYLENGLTEGGDPFYCEREWVKFRKEQQTAFEGFFDYLLNEYYC